MTPADAKAAGWHQRRLLAVTGEDFSTTVPERAILTTDPAAGTTMKRGETVNRPHLRRVRKW